MPNIITHIDQLDLNGTYTYADYLDVAISRTFGINKKTYLPPYS